MACPLDRIEHAFHFQVGTKLQTFKLRASRQDELRLANFTGQWMTWVEAAALQDLAFFALDGDPQDAWHTGDAIIGKANDEAQVTRVFVAPNKGWPHAITDAAIDAVKRGGVSLVVGHQVSWADLMEIPKGPVVCSDVHDVRDYVLCGGNAFRSGSRIGRFARQPLLEQRSDPWRAIAECFDLFILDKNGVAADPVIASNRAIEQLRIAD